MKKMKKVMALLLSLVMVLAMSVVAFAGGAATFTITAPATTHQYEIYQIFTGDLSGTTLSNVKWGKNGSGVEGEAVSETVINELTGPLQQLPLRLLRPRLPPHLPPAPPENASSITSATAKPPCSWPSSPTSSASPSIPCASNR